MKVSKAAGDTLKSDRATGKAGICGATTSPQKIAWKALPSAREEWRQYRWTWFDMYSFFSLAQLW
jgi:hypothetical protein